MEDNFEIDTHADTVQSEAESMDMADSTDYWNDIASDAEADQDTLDHVYGPSDYDDAMSDW